MSMLGAFLYKGNELIIGLVARNPTFEAKRRKKPKKKISTLRILKVKPVFFVGLQVCLSGKGHCTFLAPEGSNTRVQKTVSLHVCFASEALLALRTLVQLLASVDSHVNIQVPAVHKLWIAQRTRNFFVLAFSDGMLGAGGVAGAEHSNASTRGRWSEKITWGLKLRTYTGRGNIRLHSITDQNQRNGNAYFANRDYIVD